jgi:hypothetical protein
MIVYTGPMVSQQALQDEDAEPIRRQGKRPGRIASGVCISFICTMYVCAYVTVLVFGLGFDIGVIHVDRGADDHFGLHRRVP